MNMAAVTTPAHRARLLRALGLTPWQRRPSSGVVDQMMTMSPENQAMAECVVLLPAGCAARELDVLGRAFRSLGPALARAARIEIGEAPVRIPHARAYLVLGEAQAHALGRDLPAEIMHRAHIVLADTPAGVLAGADGKRRLWSALRSLRRALAASGG